MLFEPAKHGDERGWLCESYNKRTFAELGIVDCFVQDNHSKSGAIGTLRGLHFQFPPHGQAKLVRCTRGRIWDVAVDVRAGSPTFGQHVSIELAANNGLQLYLPVGFAHGFVTLEPDTEIQYKVSDYYAPAFDAGIAWDDQDLAIDWPLPIAGPTLSIRDTKWPRLRDFKSAFFYNGVPLMPLGL
jgi:dTDP-4-dehydrorhamnose 3,5-epimerase